MLLLACPYCGPRDETEFSYGGESHIVRPALNSSDEQWAEYLFYRDNPKGITYERWRHSFGCEHWFNVVRDTVSHRVVAVYAMGDAKPETTQSGRTGPTALGRVSK